MTADRVVSEAVLGAYRSVLGEREAVYCSSPVTSGRRYFDWVETLTAKPRNVEHALTTFSRGHRLHVLSPNIQHARKLIDELRRRLLVPVIDPTAVSLHTGWPQRKWLRLWERVIKNYCAAVVFLDDWEYSNGCVHEFHFATKVGIPTFDESGSPLSVLDALEKLARVESTLRRRGTPTTKVRAASRRLSRLNPNERYSGRSLQEVIRDAL